MEKTTIKRPLDLDALGLKPEDLKSGGIKFVSEKELKQPRLPLLEIRQQTHGNFADNARVSQHLKEVFRAQPGWNSLSDIERESMDMIALKFSRILSGKSLEKQHWEDVVGYAKLVEEICQ